MLRKLHHIPLSELTVSKLNVRRHGAKEIDSLAASIAALGIIQPLLVRGDGDGYEIVAGRRRYLAAKKLDADGAPDTDKLPCVLLEADDDATAIEASLAENVERLPMDDLEQYEAFAALRKKGLGEADIAAHFGISEQIVKRRLAIANLHPDIRRLYRAGDIDTQTLQLLTLATKERQKAWLALHNDPEQEPPPPWQLKAWLLGGAEIADHGRPVRRGRLSRRHRRRPVRRAAVLHRPATSSGACRTPPSPSAASSCSSPAGRRCTSSSPTGASSPGTTRAWPKADGGGVYIVVEPDGHVTVHKGLKPRGEARRAKRKRGEDGSGGNDGAVPSAPR